MACYQHHLKWLFDSVCVPYETAGRGRMHDVLCGLVGLEPSTECPQVWAALKERYGVDAKTPSAELVADVQQRLWR